MQSLIVDTFQNKLKKEMFKQRFKIQVIFTEKIFQVKMAMIKSYTTFMLRLLHYSLYVAKVLPLVCETF